ncbi:unnamed protein product [Haemonchus placei]|uniref:WD_REPEATS_REGION domain-containing protein n=1 Tax=Haemonchus placei TaxID=6290 RepID=A0A0N4X5P5_HAEPC|nr:unnamed protein product [Haemonchus placei]
MMMIIAVLQPHTSHLRAHCGVNDYGLHLINAATMALVSSYDHRELVWSFDVGKPYLEVHARARGHQLTIRTPQVGGSCGRVRGKVQSGSDFLMYFWV